MSRCPCSDSSDGHFELSLILGLCYLGFLVGLAWGAVRLVFGRN